MVQDRIQQIQHGLRKVGYICDDKTATILYLAEALHNTIPVPIWHHWKDHSVDCNFI